MSLRAMSSRSRLQRGVTLIELMVALVLGLLLTLGVISIFVTNQQAARTNEGLARLQESGRIAFELLSRELRQAGGNPCGALLVSNVLVNPSSNWAYDFLAGPVRGFEGNEDVPDIVPSGTGVGERVAGTDAVRVMSPNTNDGARIQNHNPANTTFTLNTVDHGVSTDEVVMVCDQQSAAIFQVTGAASGTTADIRHQDGTGGPGTPTNCTRGLGFPTLCTVNGTPKTFAPGSVLSRLNPGFWYIGNNPRGGRSLYRATQGARAEITDGVTDLQLRYLTRNAATNDVNNDWQDANLIGDWTNTATNVPIAMRIQLTLVTSQTVGTDQQALSRVQVYAVSLRNRAP